MSALYMIVGTLIALGVLVTFHEFGHFWVARRCGVKVLRFSVGFGMPLLRWHDRRGMRPGDGSKRGDQRHRHTQHVSRSPCERRPILASRSAAVTGWGTLVVV